MSLGGIFGMGTRKRSEGEPLDRIEARRKLIRDRAAAAPAGTPPPPALGSGSRPRPPGAPILGTAVPRPSTNLGGTPTPPDTGQLGADAGDSARLASIRAKKRGAGSSVLTRLTDSGVSTPPARLRTRTLLGGT